MTREKKFRGKRVDNGEWVTGLYDSYEFKSYINKEDYSDGIYSHYSFKVIPETVGEYIGTNKNGIEIYEGDITKAPTRTRYVIAWNQEKCLFAEHFKNTFLREFTLASYPIELDRIEIIGNIHDNPELL